MTILGVNVYKLIGKRIDNQVQSVSFGGSRGFANYQQATGPECQLVSKSTCPLNFQLAQLFLPGRSCFGYRGQRIARQI